jgi:hypothetical protein
VLALPITAKEVAKSLYSVATATCYKPSPILQLPFLQTLRLVLLLAQTIANLPTSTLLLLRKLPTPL